MKKASTMKTENVDGTAKYPSTNLQHAHLSAAFEAQALNTPDHIAVVYQENKLTYQQLNEKANQLARHLINQKIKAGDIVGICVERSECMIVTLLAVLKTGAAYLPIDPSYPKARIKYMLENAKTTVALTQAIPSAQLPDTIKQISLDDFEKPWQRQSKENLNLNTQTADPAYIIYTSGSTGNPKGIVQTHRTILNLVRWQSKQLPKNQHLNISQFAAFGFDVSLQEIFLAILNGHTLYIIPQEMRQELSQLPLFILENSIHLLFFPTSVLEYFSHESTEQKIFYPELIKIIVAGEALHITEVIQDFFQLQIHTTLDNQYGPSETHVASCYTLPEATKIWPKHPPIGQAINNTTLHILDKSLNPVKKGEEGQLYISGYGVAKGYINLPSKTKESFFPIKLNKKIMNVYKTGDIVKELPDGNLTFIGRSDSQVKIRGYRIELDEIESALLQQDSVRQCAVIVNHAEHRKYLTAYIKPKAKADLSEIKSALQRKLPGYMIPSAFIALNHLPMTANMKIDKKSLEKDSNPVGNNQKEITAPRTNGEKELLLILSNIAKIKKSKISVDSNFFELGLDSIAIAQLASRLEAKYFINTSIKDIANAPTIEALSKVIIFHVKKGNISKQAVISQVDRSTCLPLSLNQERLWFLAKLEPNSSAYNEFFGARLTGNLNQEALQKSFNHIINRHETLRTNFLEISGKPQQKINKSAAYEISSVHSEKNNAQQFIDLFANTPFTLTNQPLFRAKLVIISAQEHLLLFCFHHLIIDGWSIDIICQELSQLYTQYSGGKKAILPALTIQPVDYINHEKKNNQEKLFKKQINYWKNKLAAYRPTTLQKNIKKPNSENSPAGKIEIELSKQLTNKLTNFAKKQRTTTFNILFTLLSIILYKHTNKTDITIGTVFANRDQEVMQNLLGFFLNTIVLRAKFNKKTTINELLLENYTTILEAHLHQNIPFSRLVKEINPKREISGNPLFNIFLGLEPTNNHTLRITEKTEPVTANKKNPKFELSLIFEFTSTGMAALVEYDKSILDAKLVKNLTENLKHLLKKLPALADVPLASIHLKRKVRQTNQLMKTNPSIKTSSINLKPTKQPLNKVKQELINVWQVIHGKKDIKTSDNFFNIGGYSLAALDLIYRINKTFKTNLPLKTVFAAPTIEEQAKIIVGNHENSPKKSCLIPLNTVKHGTPIFLIHPVGGTVFLYQQLTNHLEINQPIYAIQDPSIENPHIYFKNFEEMASFYLKIIQEKQRSGPYFLGGASFGGVMALEIAKQLSSKGENTKKIFMFDSWARYPERIQNKAFFDKLMQEQTKQLEQEFKKLGISESKRWIDLQWKRASLIWDYKLPKDSNHEVILFKAKTPPHHFEEIEHPNNYWNNYIKQLTTITTPGTHESIFQEPNLKQLASAFKNSLNKN